MKLASMKRAPQEQRSDPACCPGEQGMPDYPYGARINLSDPELQSLGMAKLPAAGDVLNIAGIGTVMGIREEQVDGKLHRSLEIQITDLGLSSGPQKSSADILYPGGEG